LMSLLLLICGSYLILQYSPSLSLNLMAVASSSRYLLADEIPRMNRSMMTLPRKSRQVVKTF
ncbi:MAG: hypothetical protein ACEY3K_15235, partial [Wolbachia sp.]